MRRAAAPLFVASLLASCGGGGTAPSPPPAMQPTAQATLLASPSSVAAYLYDGNLTASVTIKSRNNETLEGLQWSATTLSFLSVSLQQNTSASATLGIRFFGGGTSTVTVRDAAGAFVAIPVNGIPCGRPDLTNYAALISPPNGAKNVPLDTPAYYVEAGTQAGGQAPFEPPLNAHIVVNGSSTIDPLPTLAPATPPPNAATPSSTPPPNYLVGYERGVMPQLAAGNTYTIYVYDDTCESPWNAGSFST